MAEVSEYAAWTLAHGYLANHLTVAVHRLDRETWPDGIVSFVEWVRAEGFELNAAGIQTSPDGLLLQDVAPEPMTNLAGELLLGLRTPAPCYRMRLQRPLRVWRHGQVDRDT